MTTPYPRPQRAHRLPVTPPRPRAVLSPAHHARLATRLTPRDRWLIRLLHEHRVLTTHAITAMAFPSGRAARMRLLQLYEWDVIDRFQPLLRVGAAPMHYVLGGAGAAVLAAQVGVAARALGYRRDDVLALAHHHTLAHTVAVNDLFAELVHHTVSSTTGRMRLEAWWSEARCRRHVGDYVRPDAYGRITVTGHPGSRGPARFEWFLELDFGTGTLATLARKIDRYAQLAAATTPTPVLVWLPGPRREAGARDHLTRALHRLDQPELVPLATTAAPAVSGAADGSWFDAAGPVWLPVEPRSRRPGRGSAPDTRLDLVDLAVRWPTQPATSIAVTEPSRRREDGGELPAPDPIPPDRASYDPALPATPGAR